MPGIGDLKFSLRDGFDSGIAFCLDQLPSELVNETYQDCHLLASPATPYVVCRFNGASSEEEALQKGKDRVEKALDLLSMRGIADLQVKDVQHEHLVWWTRNSKAEAQFVSTMTFSGKVGAAKLSTYDAHGNIVPDPVPSYGHQIGFRFFRLSQVSSDLYGAFRNMYLAFESLLSAKHPKRSTRPRHEKEIDWLRRALTSSASDLSITRLCPPNTADCVEHVISHVYVGARLPLFHAKDGERNFVPGWKDSDREAVRSALDLLTKLVIRMANDWYSVRRLSGWVNPDMMERGYQSSLENCALVYSDEPTDLKDESQLANLIRSGLIFPLSVNSHFDGRASTNIASILDVSALGERTKLHALYAVKGDAVVIAVTPDTVIDIEGFEQLHIRIFMRFRNASQPKYQFSL